MSSVDDGVMYRSTFDTRKGDSLKSRSQIIERKIEIFESLASKISSRRSRRWLNDCLLLELIPRLNADEIRGLFAPPPWGDNKPVSAFCMTSGKEWDVFRNVDMDEEAGMTRAMGKHLLERKVCANTDKAVTLNAWRRVDRRTRDAMRRNFLQQLIEGYEERIRAFINEDGEGEVLVLRVQDPFHRLMLHGVCEFYNLISVTDSMMRNAKLWKATRIRKKSGCHEMLPNITLAQFVRMSKDGTL